MASGLVASVQGKEIADKIVVVAKVRHSQRMNDPLVNIWIIAEKDGTIISAHCLGCKAGVAESCSHVASVMFYIEAVTDSWKARLYSSEMHMDFTNICQRSAKCKGRGHRLFISKKLKGALEQKIEILHQDTGEGSKTLEERCDKTFASHAIPSHGEMQAVYAKLNACEIKAVALSLIDTYADQFIDESRTPPIIPDLFETGNFELEYPELIKMCVEVTLGVSEEHIKKN